MLSCSIAIDSPPPAIGGRRFARRTFLRGSYRRAPPGHFQGARLTLPDGKGAAPALRSPSTSRTPFSSDSSMEPHAQRRDELLGVDGLGEVIGRARLQALVAVAHHRLRRERDDRQAAVLGLLADLAHRLVPVHL